MNLTISGHHLDVTPALREYVVSKLERIRRHFDQVVEVKVLLSVEKQKEKEKRQRAECSLRVKGSDLFVESTHADLYAHGQAVVPLGDSTGHAHSLVHEIFKLGPALFKTDGVHVGQVVGNCVNIQLLGNHAGGG